MSGLRETVRAALDTAVDENGYVELLHQRPEAVALDLTWCDADIADRKDWQNVYELVPHVKEWQADRAKAVQP